MHIGKLFSSFLIQNICCGYSKEPSQCDGSFDHPKHMFKLMGKKIIKIVRKKKNSNLDLCSSLQKICAIFLHLKSINRFKLYFKFAHITREHLDI